MNGACHCGRVTIRVPHAPEQMNACNCTLCTKLGALWGYYRPVEVEIAGDPAGYARADVAQPSLTAHFCRDCGATTHWSPTDPTRERMGVNMRLFDPAALAGIEVRYGDRRNHDERGHVYRPPSRFGDGQEQAA